MIIQQITENKREYMEFLLLADPQEDMIERYLEEGEMFVLTEEEDILTVCVVLPLDHRRCELKNIATAEKYQGRGYGKYMLQYICEHYSENFDVMYVGTGNSRKTIGFYESCGFTHSHVVTDFFTDNYREPIYEEGKLLTDMIYLKKALDTQIDVKRVLDLALEAGRILLKNGSEIFRVEETIRHICHRFHVDQVEPFTMSHGLFISAESDQGEVFTKVKNVPISGLHMGIVAEVNDLSREISAGHVGIDEAFHRLEEIDKIPPNPGRVQVAVAGMGCGGFTLLLGGTYMEAAAAVVIGCLVCGWTLLAGRLKLSKIVINIVGGVIMTTLALAFLNIPVLGIERLEGMVGGAIMPMIPGVGFLNAIRDLVDGDFLSGTVRMIDALLVFVYVAVGVGFTLGIYNNMAGGLLL